MKELDYLPQQRAQVEKRFWSKVEKTDSCWVWKTGQYPSGYGMFFVGSRTLGNRRNFHAHRVAYELIKGRIPEDKTLDHLCRNRACVNPDHLESVTMKENILRGEGICAKNARKTHCPKGHRYSEGNLLKSQLVHGRRFCLACHREQSKKAMRKFRRNNPEYSERMKQYLKAYRQRRKNNFLAVGGI